MKFRSLMLFAVALCLSVPTFGSNMVSAQDVPAAHHMVKSDSHGKTIRYTPHVETWTDMNRELLREFSLDVSGKVLTSVLLAKEGSSPIGAVMPKGFKQWAKKIFRLVRLRPLERQWQLNAYFVPTLDSPSDYTPELESNRLLLLDRKGSLLDEISAAEKPLDIERLLPIYQKILKNNKENLPFTYLSGITSVSLEIGDLNLRLSKIFSSKKNFIKGFIRYRLHYYNHLAAASTQVECQKGSDCSITTPQTGADSEYMTVDIYRLFNIENIKEKKMPDLHAMTIHFGRILDAAGNDILKGETDKEPLMERPYISRRWIPGLIADALASSNAHKEALPKISGSLNVRNSSTRTRKFDFAMDRLSYLFESQTFDPKASIFLTAEGKTASSRELKKVLPIFKDSLIEMLKLDHFVDRAEFEKQ